MRGLIGEVTLLAVIAEDSLGVCHDQDIQQVIDTSHIFIYIVEDIYQDQNNEKDLCMFVGTSISIIDCPSMNEKEYTLSVMG